MVEGLKHFGKTYPTYTLSELCKVKKPSILYRWNSKTVNMLAMFTQRESVGVVNDRQEFCSIVILNQASILFQYNLPNRYGLLSSDLNIHIRSVDLNNFPQNEQPCYDPVVSFNVLLMIMCNWVPLYNSSILIRLQAKY